MDEPLFQPFPPEVVFAGYEPHGVYEATLRLRNNDQARRRSPQGGPGPGPAAQEGAARCMRLAAARCGRRGDDSPPAPPTLHPHLQVARRVRVEACDSAQFSVRHAGRAGSAADSASRGGESSKVAPGMEVTYIVSFQPNSAADARGALLVATERERFAVPLVAAGAAPALDLPDAIAMRDAPPVRAAAQQPLLVRNVGAAPGGFTLAASGPFSVSPACGHLAPGESLQAVLTFVPAAAGHWEGELEVVYEGSGRSTYTRLVGKGREMAVGLSADTVDFLPAHLGRLTQKSVWVVNDGDRPVAFAFKQRPAVQQDQVAAEAALAALGAADDPESSIGGGTTGGGAHGHRAAQAETGRDLPAAGSSSASIGDDAHTRDTDASVALSGVSLSSRPDTSASAGSAAPGSGSSLLADSTLAATRAAKRDVRDAAAAAAAAAFASPHFAAFPPCGVVPPGGRAEVVLQFAPDHAQLFEATAYVELDGRNARQPVVLRGRGLGAVACFTYETLDVGDAFVNTLHEYTLELANRGKVDADFSLQHSHTK